MRYSQVFNLISSYSEYKDFMVGDIISNVKLDLTRKYYLYTGNAYWEIDKILPPTGMYLRCSNCTNQDNNMNIILIYKSGKRGRCIARRIERKQIKPKNA